jgi:hypothetical protein
MCEVDFSFSDNKKDFTNQKIQFTLAPLLKENFSYLIQESEMDLALSSLNAGILEMNLAG